MTIKEIEAEIERLKAEKRKLVNEKRFPKDIIKTKEYGWVKLLPCGVGETVYTYKLTCPISNSVYDPIKNQIGIIHYSIEEYLKNAKMKVIVSIIPITMIPSLYPKINHTIYVTEDEAIEHVEDFLRVVLIGTKYSTNKRDYTTDEIRAFFDFSWENDEEERPF